MRRELLARLSIRLGDVDRDTPAHLSGIGLVTRFLARFAEHAEDAAERVNVEIGNAHVGVAALGDKVDRLQTAGARNPDGRMRLLERPRPGVDVAEEIVLRVPHEWAGRRP